MSSDSTTASLGRARRDGAGLGAVVRSRARSLARVRPELVGLLVLAGLLNLWSLKTNGWANEYYSAAVRSMSTSWHDFLYGSFDSSGVMTVDKPPMALWLQALSVRMFGYGSLAMLVPQALMGMASVALVYDLTRRRFGRVGGSVAGVVLALTPISVAISRHNNPDALLILCAVAALWLLLRGLEDGRTRWLVWAGVAVGLGFETKMGAALLVVPGIVAAWLWVRPRGWRAAIGQVAAFAGAMVVVGAAWPVLVWLTPAADRPWISGTSDNSIWSLIVNYNGVGRLDGQAGGPQGMAGGGLGGGAGVFGGSSGPFRLLGDSLGGQAGWLLGFALVGGLAVVAASRLRRADARTGWIVAVGGAFLTAAVAFSFAKGIFHPYYVSLLAPFSAALVGAGAAQVGGRERLARVLGPAAVLAGVATELVVLGNVGGLTWVRPLLIVVGVAAAVALAVVAIPRVRAWTLGVALAALLVAPAIWSVDTLGHATSGTFPAGGPASASSGGPGGGFGGGRRAGGFGGPARGGFGGPPPPGGAFGGPRAGAGAAGGGMFGGNSAELTSATAYAKAHGGGTIAISSQSGASSSIITSDASVAAIGGFSGRESTVSIAWLADAVQSGRIRWILTDGTSGAMRNDGRVGSADAMAAVAKVCTATSTAGASSSTTTSTSTLYDCSGAAAKLRALG